jgi:hypothetical protein
MKEACLGRPLLSPASNNPIKYSPVSRIKIRSYLKSSVSEWTRGDNSKKLYPQAMVE